MNDVKPLDRIDEGAHLIPDYMVGAARRYIMNGIPPGSFLTSVICNDLREAVANADDENAARLQGWVRSNGLTSFMILSP